MKRGQGIKTLQQPSNYKHLKGDTMKTINEQVNRMIKQIMDGELTDYRYSLLDALSEGYTVYKKSISLRPLLEEEVRAGLTGDLLGYKIHNNQWRLVFQTDRFYLLTR